MPENSWCKCFSKLEYEEKNQSKCYNQEEEYAEFSKFAILRDFLDYLHLVRDRIVNKNLNVSIDYTISVLDDAVRLPDSISAYLLALDSVYIDGVV